MNEGQIFYLDKDKGYLYTKFYSDLKLMKRQKLGHYKSTTLYIPYFLPNDSKGGNIP